MADDFDVQQWLEGVGMGQYVRAFEENDITHEALRELTSDDLKELGVAAMGHRKILLREIASLSAAPAAVPGDRRRC